MPAELEVDGKTLAVSKILCLAKNYVGHAKEFGGEVPKEPVYFLKPPSCLLPGGGVIRMPTHVGRVDVETELAVVLGAGGHDLSSSQAMSLVAGYAVFFDITCRELQGHARKEGLPWSVPKGYDTFGPISRIVPARQVRDPHGLSLRLRVNGTVRQDATTKQMVFRIPETLAAISRVMTLEPGDILATGTPEGVWPIVPGDVLEADIAEVGSLRCTVAARKP